MIKLAQPKVAKKDFSAPKLAAPVLSRVQLKSIELTCGYYGWEYKYSFENGKSRLTLIIDNIVHDVKVYGRDFVAFSKSGKELNLSEYMKMSRKFAEAGIFKMPKKFTEETFERTLWESIASLVRITPQLQLSNGE